MDPHPDDVTTANDLELVGAARAGDRLAFGVLYLRHHAAAWRVACVASRFSPDAELAVIEGFTRVFSALPLESDEFDEDRVSFRLYLLACVRQAALDRARDAGRAEAPKPRRRTSGPKNPPAPAALAGLGPDGEVVLTTLEHHVVRGALAALPERSRTALWLTDVEAMTPGELAGILGGEPQEVSELATRTRAEVRSGREAALGYHEVRSDCRFTVANLGTFSAGTLDPAKGVLVRSHLDVCPPCRMRLAEMANAPAALAAAVPAAPLLGGETQHHWLCSGADVRPAERLLPPGLAAVPPAHRLPDVLRRAGRAAAGWLPQPDTIDLTTSTRRTASTGWMVSAGGTTPPSDTDPLHSPGWTGAPGPSGSPTPALPPAWTIPPGRGASPGRRDRRTRRLRAVAGTLPLGARQTSHRIWPTLPAAFLVVAWLGVMLALPRLFTPDTAPGPGGMALPAVQAYVPDHLLPGRPGSSRAPQPGPRPGDVVPAGGISELASGAGADVDAQLTGAGTPERAGSGGQAASAPSVKLIPTARVRPSRPSGPARPDVTVPTLAPTVDAVAAVVPITVAAALPAAPAVDASPASPGKPTKAIKPSMTPKPRPETKPRRELKPRKPEPSADRPEARRSDRPQRPERVERAERLQRAERKRLAPRGRAVSA